MTDEKKKPEDSNEADGFGLTAPESGIVNPEEIRPAPEVNKGGPAPPPVSAIEPGQGKALAWKGFEEEEEYEPDVIFGADREPIEDEMDMTPMVDVVFLLLIFFMVTASFVTQQTIETPPPPPDDPSTTVIDTPEDEEDYVDVVIDQNNIYRITTRDSEEIEAPSDNEMRAQVKHAFDTLNPKRLTITIHEEAWHEKEVTVWDFGTELGFEEIQIKSTDEDY